MNSLSGKHAHDSHSSNDDVGRQVVAVSDGEGDGELPALGVRNAVARKLLLALVGP